MGKHAYMIMAHNEFGILEKLIQLLDYEENDIFLHIDKKVQNFPKEEWGKLVKKSKLVYLPATKVNWGGYSQIACEMNIFQYMVEQVDERYQYYHLISGVDLPLKSQKEIHEFFDEHDGQEFVTIGEYNPDEKEYLFRVKYYYPFQELIGAARPKGKNPLFFRTLAAGCNIVQKILHIDRCKGEKMVMGANWINITYDCMKYIVSEKENIQNRYKMTVCADEMFVQNTLLNSPFSHKIYKEPIRFIDWKRGRPYVFRETDYEELMHSEYLWARKFDTKVDGKIADMIFETVKEKETLQ